MVIKCMKTKAPWTLLFSVMILLLMTGAAHAQSSLLQLAQSGSPQEVAMAIEAGEDANAQDADGTTALMLAAAFNEDAGVVKVLVDAGANVNARDLNGVTPLMYAANFNENPSVARILIEAGADVNLQSVRKITALMTAAVANRNPEMVLVLLDAGADSGARDTLGNTALDHAALNDALKGTSAYETLLRETAERERSANRDKPVERDI